MVAKGNSLIAESITRNKIEHGRLEARIRVTPEQISEIKKRAKKHFENSKSAGALYDSQYRRKKWFSKKDDDVEVDAKYSFNACEITVHTQSGYMNSSINNRELHIKVEGLKDFAQDFYEYLNSIA